MLRQWILRQDYTTRAQIRRAILRHAGRIEAVARLATRAEVRAWRRHHTRRAIWWWWYAHRPLWSLVHRTQRAAWSLTTRPDPPRKATP